MLRNPHASASTPARQPLAVASPATARRRPGGSLPPGVGVHYPHPAEVQNRSRSEPLRPMNSKRTYVTDTRPSAADMQRVSVGLQMFGAHALKAEAGVGMPALMRCAVGLAVKGASLRCVLAAVDRLESARARKLQNSDERGAA